MSQKVPARCRCSTAMELLMPNDDEHREGTRGYSSPPCFVHELTSDYRVQAGCGDNIGWKDVVRWRRAERKRLIGERLALDLVERNRKSKRIASKIETALGRIGGRILALYWPVRGEPDVRNWMIQIIERGSRVAKDRPLEFCLWSPGDPLERGIWDILVPARGSAVQPHIIIAPGVGFDQANHRLGYGGGLLDRTLAKMMKKPQVIGVGYAESQLKTIYPQPLDVPMDLVVTDK